MSHKDQTVPESALLAGHGAHDPLLPRVIRSLELSSQYSKSQIRCDTHWCGEVGTNAVATAEYIILCQALNIDVTADRKAFTTWLLSLQNSDGGWGATPDSSSDVSITVEVYLALRILGILDDDDNMRNARNFALSAGGVARVRILTRISLATFGLFPWSGISMFLPELVLLLLLLPCSIYRYSAWVQTILVPYSIIIHHRPIHGLATRAAASGDYLDLDGLWCDQDTKQPEYNSQPWTYRVNRLVAVIPTFATAILHRLNTFRPIRFIHRCALQRCLDWITRHYDDLGDIGEKVLPLYGAVLALSAQGYPPDSDPIRQGLDVIERYSYFDGHGKRIQSMITVCWDTSLMVTGLLDSGLELNSWQIARPLAWVRAHQRDRQKCHWKVDDIAVTLVAIIRQGPESLSSGFVLSALRWLLEIQCRDGGWIVFHYRDSMLSLASSPFASSLVSSCPAVTGHVLEAFGLFLMVSRQRYAGIDQSELHDHVMSASQRAIYFLSAMQKPSGTWCARWDSHYIYGTSIVLRALSYFIGSKQRSQWVERDDSIHDDVHQAILWLEAIQNQDGGWGEDSRSSGDPLRTGTGPSTIAQTASALIALLPYKPPTSTSIRRGVDYILARQMKTCLKGATWTETNFTASSVPKYAENRNVLYPHSCAMMALGRYIASIQEQGL